jgi:2-oxoglutarate dehydrogenase E2 component (dihydrolipoamide succinyltransferase)
MAVDVEIPGMGESVTEVILIEWLKADGEMVERDEPICVLETDKANVDLPAPASGVLRHVSAIDDVLEVGNVLARIGAGGEDVAEPAAELAEPEPSAAAAAAADQAEQVPAAPGAEQSLGPAVRRLVEEQEIDPAEITGTGKDGRLTKADLLTQASQPQDRPPSAARQDVPAAAAPPAPEPKAATTPPQPEKPARAAASEAPRAQPAPRASASAPAAAGAAPAAGGERREPMSRIRKRIAQHLVAAQQNAAMLTTFNEVDMSGVMELRKAYKERFTEVHGVSLGLMSFFSRAAVLALQEFPSVNAFIDGEEIVYHDYVNLGIAVSTSRGLLVPVLQRAEQMSMATIESEIKRLASGARDNKLGMDDLSGGTFTITNGGVFGSLLSTPILNAPQSGILGMHTIQQRPVAVNGQVEIRPMMYVALSYDHRLVDGQQSVKFLVRLKQLLEDPARMLLQV